MEQYKLAQRYMVMKMQRENTSGGEGVEVIVSEPFKDDQLGEGLYTRKLYRLERYVWLVDSFFLILTLNPKP
jgi:hypothetical protein